MANLKQAFEYASQNPDSDFAKNLANLASSGSLNKEAEKYGIDLTPFQPEKQLEIEQKKEQKQQGETGLAGVATGVGKGILSTVKGAGQLGEKIGKGALGLVGIDIGESVYSDEATKGGLLGEKNLQTKSTAEKIGKFGEQVAEFAVPASKLAKAGKGLGLAKKIGSRALTSGTVGVIQEGEVGKGAGIAAGVETVLPVAGKVLKPVTKIVSRLFKNLASGLSGANKEIITQIIENPKLASAAKKELLKEGNSNILKENAKTIVNGVSTIKKEARKAFGEGLEKLGETDIKSKTFRDSTQKIFDKYGSIIKNGERQLKNIEFDEVKNIKRADELLSRLQKTKLDGKSLRRLADDIENSKFKVATSDERLAYNAFANDLSSSLKDAISKSTTKLNEINKSFSKDIQLAESIENIFGKIKFKNTTEINKVSQKLETLFNQKGLTPEYIDNFLTRIGLEPAEFKTKEAIRQISKAEVKANSQGISWTELLQGLSSAILPPQTVRDAAIIVGKNEALLKTLLENTSPSGRALLIETLTPNE